MKKSGLLTAILYATGIFLVFYIPFLGKVHIFDGVEKFFTEVVRDYLGSENYFSMLDEGSPLWHFPPVFIWIQSFITGIAGSTMFSMRLSGPVAGLISLLVIYRIGRRVLDEKFGLVWLMAYAGTLLPLLYFRSGLPYPWTNLFMMLAVTHFAYYFIFHEKRIYNLVLSAFFLGLAILTTGPVLLVIILITFFSWWAVNRFMITIYWRDVVIYLTTLLAFGGWWFILHVKNGNPDGLKDVLSFHFRNLIDPLMDKKSLVVNPVLFFLFGLFPVFIFSLPALKGSILESYRAKSFSLWMRVFFWISLVFSLLTNRLVNNYATISFFPLSFLGAQMIYRIFQDKEKYREYFRFLLMLISVFLSGTYVWLCLVGMGIIGGNDILGTGMPEMFIIFSEPGLWSWSDLLPALVFLVVIYFGLYGIRYKRTGLIIIFLSSALFISSVSLMFSVKYERMIKFTGIEYSTVQNSSLTVKQVII